MTNNSKFWSHPLVLSTLAATCAGILTLTGIFLYLDPQIPEAKSYRNVKLVTPLRIYANDGALLAEFGERRVIPITLDQVPQHFINALLDTEDKRFYEHSGIDFISLTNDILSLVGTFMSAGELGGGASTITMQVARNVSFSLERRFLRKFKEMLLALKIERELSKDEILELYINLVPFGKRAYGAQAAAQTYYGKPLAELTLPQLAMLAGIPQAPTAGNPINGPARALARRNLVLMRMYSQNSISQEAFESAKNAPITAQIYARELDQPSPYPAEWVRQQAASLLPDLYTGGYKINTTLHTNLQSEAIAALRRGLHLYDARHGWRGPERRADPALLSHLEASIELDPQPADTSKSSGAEHEDLQLAITRALADIPTYGELEAAMVISTDKNQAAVQRIDGSTVTLRLQQTQWARPYISADRRGPVPLSMQDILRSGDIIRLRREGANWLLSQLPEIQGALVALDPANGAVRALVGGYDFYRNQYNHATQAARQPGSGFKPFVYSAALASGISPADVFMDAPLVFDDKNLESQYRPGNDNNRYNGPTRLREALYRSINLVSMRVLLEVGAGQALNHVAKFGFDTRDFPRNTQLAIGGGTMAVTPIDMARGYAVLANGGYLIEPHIIKSIVAADGTEIFRTTPPSICNDCAPDRTGQPSAQQNVEPDSLEALLTDDVALAALQSSSPEGDSIDLQATSMQPTTPADKRPEPLATAAPRIIDERNIFIMNSMLQDVIKRGTGRAARRLERSDLAGKTGTTNDAADTWFNGYSPDLVTSVWVGFSNHAPLGAREYGSNTPLPIWIDFMEDALSNRQERAPTQPPGLVTVKIDPKTGEVAHPSQTNAVFEYFLREHAPEAELIKEPSLPSTQNDDINALDIFSN
ncbi:MAG: PBP1A family penicillin-binding protein [Gammaproteobacteria bacterium]|nr:PBP1A family penicillin-binding protein [Gammaproteobacteria bacterium]